MAEFGRIDVCPGKRLVRILKELSQAQRALQRELWLDMNSVKAVTFNVHPASTVIPKKKATALAIAGAFRVHKTVRE